jgi:hypothetical protein
LRICCRKIKISNFENGERKNMKEKLQEIRENLNKEIRKRKEMIKEGEMFEYERYDKGLIHGIEIALDELKKLED